MKNEIIINYLDELFPDPKCELTYFNDYSLLMAIVLSAQCTDKRVNMITPVIFDKYKDLYELSNADIKDLEDIIRPVGSFRKKSLYLKEIANILLEKYNGKVPTNKKDLEELPGVGRKTANVFLSEFYNYPAIAVDTHVERVSKRLKLAYNNDNVNKVEEKLMNKFPKDKWAKIHIQLVLFGRYYCKAIKPECKTCKLKEICRYRGIDK